MQRKSFKFGLNEEERGMVKRIANDLQVTEAQAIRLAIAIFSKNLDDLTYRETVKVLLKRKAQCQIECVAQILPCFSLINEKVQIALEALLNNGLLKEQDYDSVRSLINEKQSTSDIQEG